MCWGESAHQQSPQTSQVVTTWEERHQLSQAQRAQGCLAPEDLLLLVQQFGTCSKKTLTQHPSGSRGTSFQIGLLIQSLGRLTQMSHLPGKNLSGMRAAYSAAPVMYRHAMSASQPICPIVAAFRSPSEMTKCRVGITPLRPRPRNTPGR